MSIEIAFRINEEIKQRLISKSKDLGINLSELIRTILRNSRVFKYDVNKIKELTSSIKCNHDFNSRVYVQIDSMLVSKLNAILDLTKLKLSLIMRLIIDLDNTEIMDSSYLDKCLTMLYSIGLQINQTAYQLNLDNIKKVIGYTSYKVAESRLKNIGHRLHVVDSFLNEFLYDDEYELILLINKNLKLAYLFQLSSITNNLQQILFRLEKDFLAKIISESLFNELLIIAKDTNTIIQTIRSNFDIFIGDKIK